MCVCVLKAVKLYFTFFKGMTTGARECLAVLGFRTLPLHHRSGMKWPSLCSPHFCMSGTLQENSIAETQYTGY